MGVYTSIYFTPTDRTWLAPPEFVSSVAAMLGASTFDHFAVYREVRPDPTLDDDERYEETLSMRAIPVGDALRSLRSDSGHWTHVMFPYRDFIKNLVKEVAASVPDSLSRKFIPWDTSFQTGHWAVRSSDDGALVDGGACAFIMHANGCPADKALYLERFLAVDGVARLQHQLEALSKQPWTAGINVS